MSSLHIYNSLSRRKEEFKPLNPPFVGLYVCGPTVYSDAHLGHSRPAITFDLLYRYLKYQGFKVRYVRNITDVGHLENEEEESGQDKISKKAKAEQLEPMEVVQHYMNTYHRNLEQLNTLPPDIEPRATGHIIEQQQLVEKLLETGYAYEVNGSVYFDVLKYNEKFKYGKLSGRVLEDLMSQSRSLQGQDEKRNPFDFALWKKASPAHIMRWPSAWSEGFPGWHLECSAMSMKYLGEEFDIHGGGMDLQFPHHECEIAQSAAATGKESVRYWMHNNMITINGQKMARSLGNFITLNELFSGKHEVLQQAYSPMTIRFFVLQAHYRSTVDFSNEALQAAEKGYRRLMEAMAVLEKLPAADTSTVEVKPLVDKCFEALNDDLNSPVAIAHLFDGVRLINSVAHGKDSLSEADLHHLQHSYKTLVFDILGLKNEEAEASGNEGLSAELVERILQIRLDAKKNKDFALSDRIRDELTALGIEIKDTKDGFEWKMN